jgi:hypothetical protein
MEETMSTTSDANLAAAIAATPDQPTGNAPQVPRTDFTFKQAVMGEVPLQDIFDRIAVHLLAQKARSVRARFPGETSCAYRGTSGMSCAVGCIITDGEYMPQMEGDSVNGVAFQLLGAAVADSLQDSEQVDLMTRLQRMHDTDVPGDWKERLKDLAFRFNLNTDVIRNM